VFCEQFPSEKNDSEDAQRAMADFNGNVANGDGEDLDDFDFDSNNKKKKKKNRYTIISPLVEVPGHICCCDHTGFQHFVHECCLEKLDGECPRCLDLQSRLHYASASSLEMPTYCENVMAMPGYAGIVSTSKMEKVLHWVKKVPDGEKVILYSFFKSTLDLFEGVLVEACGIECARFDGDMNPYVRSEQLAMFKASDTCKVLLATVQSSGTGLNIVEANHVGFIDRWFNPCVHAQAEDRVSSDSHPILLLHQLSINLIILHSVIVLDKRKMYLLNILTFQRLLIR
jgi:SNF2 family DNA or RNA helicase